MKNIIIVSFFIITSCVLVLYQKKSIFPSENSDVCGEVRGENKVIFYKTNKEGKAISSQIRNETINGCHSSSNDNKVFEISKDCLENIKKLDLSGKNISDKGLYCISSYMPNLRTLDLSNNQIKDISGISKIPYLKHLDLSNNGISNIKALGALKFLKTLKINNNKNLNEIDAIGNLEYLEKLDLSNNNIKYLPSFKGLIYVKDLNLSNNKIENINSLNALKYLETVDLSSNKIGNIEPLRDCVQILDLNISGNEKIRSLSSISNLRRIKKLNASDNRINDISGIYNMAYIEDLDISSNEVYDISQVSRLTTLKNLNLSSNNINDVSSISDLKNLEMLELGGNNIGKFSDEMEVINRTLKNKVIWLVEDLGLQITLSRKPKIKQRNNRLKNNNNTFYLEWEDYNSNNPELKIKWTNVEGAIKYELFKKIDEDITKSVKTFLQSEAEQCGFEYIDNKYVESGKNTYYIKVWYKTTASDGSKVENEHSTENNPTSGYFPDINKRVEYQIYSRNDNNNDNKREKYTLIEGAYKETHYEYNVLSSGSTYFIKVCAKCVGPDGSTPTLSAGDIAIFETPELDIDMIKNIGLSFNAYDTTKHDQIRLFVNVYDSDVKNSEVIKIPKENDKYKIDFKVEVFNEDTGEWETVEVLDKTDCSKFRFMGVLTMDDSYSMYCEFKDGKYTKKKVNGEYKYVTIEENVERMESFLNNLINNKKVEDQYKIIRFKTDNGELALKETELSNNPVDLKEVINEREKDSKESAMTPLYDTIIKGIDALSQNITKNEKNIKPFIVAFTDGDNTVLSEELKEKLRIYYNNIYSKNQEIDNLDKLLEGYETLRGKQYEDVTQLCKEYIVHYAHKNHIGIISVAYNKKNEVLEEISKKTGGKYFEASQESSGLYDFIYNQIKNGYSLTVDCKDVIKNEDVNTVKMRVNCMVDRKKSQLVARSDKISIYIDND